MENKPLKKGYLGSGAEDLVMETWCEMAEKGYIKSAAATGKSNFRHNISDEEIDKALKKLGIIKRPRYGDPIDGIIVLNDNSVFGIEVKKGETVGIGDHGVKDNFLYHIVSAYFKMVFVFFGKELITSNYSKIFEDLNSEIKSILNKYADLYNNASDLPFPISFNARVITVFKKIVSSKQLKNPESDIYKRRWVALEDFRDRRKSQR